MTEDSTQETAIPTSPGAQTLGPTRNAKAARITVRPEMVLVRVELPRAQYVCPGCNTGLSQGLDQESVRASAAIGKGQAINAECPYCGQPVTLHRPVEQSRIVQSNNMSGVAALRAVLEATRGKT